jgi:hypothetical protein
MVVQVIKILKWLNKEKSLEEKKTLINMKSNFILVYIFVLKFVNLIFFTLIFSKYFL